MDTVRLRLGELLVDARIITRQQLDEVLLAQKGDGRRLGTLLVERGFINETQLTQILSQQLSVPWVSLYHVDFSKRLLGMVPADVARKYCLVPIYVRHVRGQGDTLYVAMDDPTNLEALRECAAWSGLPTRAMIASPSDIRQAISVYYGAEPEKAEEESPPTRVEGVRPARSESPRPAEPEATVEPAPQTSSEPIEPPPAPSVPPAEPLADTAAQATAEQDAAATEAQDAPAPAPSSIPPASARSLGAGTLEEEPAPQRVAAQDESTHQAHEAHEVSLAEEVAPAEEGPLPTPRYAEQLHEPAAQVEQHATASTPARPADDDVRVEVGGELSLDELLAQQGARAQQQVKRSKSGKMLSLTLLDGTTLALPVVGKGKRRGESMARWMGEQAAAPEPLPPAPATPPATRMKPVSEPPPELVDESVGGEHGLGARDIIAALRAAAHGVDASEMLGHHARWETLMGALLAMLIRKHLITEEELLEELRRM